MNMAEIFPAVMGFVLGLLLGGVHSSYRRWVVALVCNLPGLSATIAFGEFRISWDFLFADIFFSSHDDTGGHCYPESFSSGATEPHNGLGAFA
jgi:hypothetical protein